MKDPELNEDFDLEPYQGELFPTKKSGSGKQTQYYKTRGEVRGRSTTPFDSIATPDWLKPPSGEIKIDYD